MMTRLRQAPWRLILVLLLVILSSLLRHRDDNRRGAGSSDHFTKKNAGHLGYLGVVVVEAQKSKDPAPLFPRPVPLPRVFPDHFAEEPGTSTAEAGSKRLITAASRVDDVLRGRKEEGLAGAYPWLL